MAYVMDPTTFAVRDGVCELDVTGSVPRIHSPYAEVCQGVQGAHESANQARCQLGNLHHLRSERGKIFRFQHSYLNPIQ